MGQVGFEPTTFRIKKNNFSIPRSSAMCSPRLSYCPMNWTTPKRPSLRKFKSAPGRVFEPSSFTNEKGYSNRRPLG